MLQNAKMITRCIATILLFVCALPQTYPTNFTVEDDYIYQFGNHSIFRYWEQARVWNVDDDEPLLKRFCAEAHRLSGKGSCGIDWIRLRERLLVFRNPNYTARGVDVVEYTVVPVGYTTPADMDNIQHWELRNKGPKWAITKGRRLDCAYYLDLVNDTASGRVYSLAETNAEVCGIHIVDDVSRPPVPKGVTEKTTTVRVQSKN